MAIRLEGAPVAAAMTGRLTERVEALKDRGTVPTLAILRVGETPGDVAYERSAVRQCDKVGIQVRQFLLKKDCSQQELLKTVRQINEDDTIHGCLLLRPLPRREDEEAACALLRPEKDVDCITASALGRVFTNQGMGFLPCTAQAVMELLNYYQIDPAGKLAAVIGRSLVIGKPVSMLLLGRNATVTMCHTGTTDLAKVCGQADILVAAAGRARMVDPSFTNPNQIVIDVGVNVDEQGKLCGDVNFPLVESNVAAITPVPGGVGSVTTAVLSAHVVEAAETAAAK